MAQPAAGRGTDGAAGRRTGDSSRRVWVGVKQLPLLRSEVRRRARDEPRVHAPDSPARP